MSNKQTNLYKIIIVILSISVFSFLVNLKYSDILIKQQNEQSQIFNSSCLTLESHIDESMIFIYGLRGFVYSQINDLITEEEFRSYAIESQAYSKYIKNFSIAPNNIQEFVYPVAGNEVTLGHDLSKDPRENVRLAVRQAEESKSVIVSGPYELRQGGLGMIIRTPIFNNTEYWGLVNVAVDVDSIISDSFNNYDILQIVSNINVRSRNFWENKSFSKYNIFYHLRVLNETWIVSGYISETLFQENLNILINSILLYFIMILLLSISAFTILKKLLSLRSKVETISQKDLVTGLPNRYALENTANDLIYASKQFCLAFLDLNGFKDINDSLGHSAGDYVLVEIAKRLNSDKYNLYRWGGDEFIILYKSISKQSMKTLIDELMLTISQTMNIHGESYSLSSCTGIVSYPDDSDNTEELLRLANATMNKAKSHGKNKVILYSNIIGETLKNEFKIERMLSTAIKNNDFILFYQPMMNLDSLTPVKAEVLLRWKSDEGEFIPPDLFIPIAENNQMIEEIDEIVLKSSLYQLSQWINKDILLKLSVNISPNHFNHNLVKLISDLLRKYNIPQGMLELEITETALIEDIHNSKELISLLKQLGVSIALDDFGKGYSSLTYLSELNIDTLKIDKSFIGKLHERKKEYIIVKSIMDIAKSLGIQTVAEGVENKEHLDILKAFGCDIIQGYYIRKPSDVASFEKWFEDSAKNF